MMQSDVARRARAHLRKVDPVMAQVMKAVGPYRPGDRTGGSHLHALIRAIVFQQLSGKAATTIHNRFPSSENCGKTKRVVTVARFKEHAPRFR